LRDGEQAGDPGGIVVRTEVSLTLVIVVRADIDDLVADVWIAALDVADDVRRRPAVGFEGQLVVATCRGEAEATEAIRDQLAGSAVAVGIRCAAIELLRGEERHALLEDRDVVGFAVFDAARDHGLGWRRWRDDDRGDGRCGGRRCGVDLLLIGRRTCGQEETQDSRVKVMARSHVEMKHRSVTSSWVEICGTRIAGKPSQESRLCFSGPVICDRIGEDQSSREHIAHCPNTGHHR
jgi:hypothetical protein